MYRDLLNKKVLVRSYDAGVYFGTLTKVEGETVRMENVAPHALIENSI